MVVETRMPDLSPRRLMVHCQGGLGNQIFQYAAGLYFADRLSASLEIIPPQGAPDSLQSRGYARPFQLDKFSLAEWIRPAGWPDRLILSTKPAFRPVQKILCSIARMQSMVEPSTYNFLPALLDQAPARTIYLTGFWQAAGYAEAIAERLRTALRIRNPLLPRNNHYANAIRALKQPVSVHLRIGDFALHTAVESGNDKRVSWVLRKSYYHKAIAHMRSILPEAELVVFSDDPVGARAIMDREQVSLWVEGNAEGNAFEELQLMSYCKHHIIANSTFSWWGAWLNADSDKIVLAPEYWHNTHNSYYPDLFPATWRVLDNLS
jgi:hypothetical protein